MEWLKNLVRVLVSGVDYYYMKKNNHKNVSPQ